MPLPEFSRLRRAVTGALAGLVMVASGASAGDSATAKLDAFHAGLIERYPDVAHLSAGQFAAMSPDDVVLFDVREEDEFGVSHIDGAIQVSPSVRASRFLREFGEMIDGKQVIFYCSVGERSSRLAARVMSALGSNRPEAIYNLEGGIFQWHNTRQNVVAARGPTSAIHPYNRKWGQLLERDDLIRMRPEAE